MKFTATAIDSAYLIDIEPIVDERGFFARAWCREEFRRHGLVAELAQTNIAVSKQRGTLRGLHFLAPPHQEAKLVRCTRGSSLVVVADIRRTSPTYLQTISIELTAENHRQLYVPPGCTQGYQTLVDDTEMFYQMSLAFIPGATRGIRYDDPSFQIAWPLPISSISAADQSWPWYASESIQPDPQPTSGIAAS